MSRIDLDLLRRSAEHNEGCISSLEEITLHQREIIKIELLETCCRHLKILYLQNNIIEKMEGLNKLKELEYLNLALNNISVIEGIDGCESLRKLDLTVNFIDLEDLEESLINLRKIENIRELFLTGNPCTDWKGYKEFVIATVPQLVQLDGTDIKKKERIEATQKYDDLLADLIYQAEMKKIKKKQEEDEFQAKEEERKRQNGGVLPPRDPNEKVPYTKEVRREMYFEQAKQKEDKDRQENPKKYEEKKETPMFKSNGEIRQCNEGKFKFRLREWDDPDYTFFELQLPKFLDTSLLDVNLNPKWVSVRVRDKLTQLKITQEIMVEESKIQRSQTTGQLAITMKKLKTDEILKAAADREQEEERIRLESLKIQKEEERKKIEKQNKLIEKYERKVLEPTMDSNNKNNDISKEQLGPDYDDVPDLE